MKLIEFERLCSDIVDRPVTLYLLTNQDAKKWYDQRFNRAESVELNTIYGVKLGGGSVIDFMFKVGASMDTLLKTFITQYTTKVAEHAIVDGQMVRLTKQERLTKLIEANAHRVHKGLFYTTLYGIGMFDFFNSDEAHSKLHAWMSEYLLSVGVTFKNEYSDARWVWRYKFNMPIEATNKLLDAYNNESYYRAKTA